MMRSDNYLLRHCLKPDWWYRFSVATNVVMGVWLLVGILYTYLDWRGLI